MILLCIFSEVVCFLRILSSFVFPHSWPNIKHLKRPIIWNADLLHPHWRKRWRILYKTFFVNTVTFVCASRSRLLKKKVDSCISLYARRCFSFFFNASMTCYLVLCQIGKISKFPRIVTRHWFFLHSLICNYAHITKVRSLGSVGGGSGLEPFWKSNR